MTEQRELIELQAQARILDRLEYYQLENGGDWLGAWIDLKAEINHRIIRIKKAQS